MSRTEKTDGAATADFHRRPGRIPPFAGWGALLAFGVAAVLLAQILPPGVARGIVALPPVLLIPGFSLLTLVLGRSRPHDPVLLGVYSIALSFAVLMFDALAFNALGVRLDTVSLGLGALAATAVVMGVAMASGWEVGVTFGAAADDPAEDEAAAAADPFTGSERPRPGWRVRAGAMVVSVAAALAVVSLVATHLPAPASKPFTSLSLGPPWAARANATEVVTGQRVTIPVVAENHGATAGDYQLTTSVDGTATVTQSVYLSSSATWQGRVGVVAPAGRELHRVTISLAAAGVAAGDQGQLTVYLDNDTP